MDDLISIIVPVYNLGQYIETSVSSLCQQTYKNIEIIIINDGSTDETASVLNQLKKKDERIRVINQENRGVSVARNLGLKKMKGKYYIFADGDDTLNMHGVEMLARIAKETSADVVCARVNAVTDYSAHRLLQPIEDTGETSIISGSEAAVRLLYENGIENGPIAKLFSRRMNGVSFPVGISIAEDLYYNYTVFVGARKIALLDAPLYYYFQRANSAMRSSFSSKKMDGLLALSRIDAHGDAAIKNALRVRTFMEAMYNLVQMDGVSGFSSEREKCRSIVRENTRFVARDTKATKKSKLYAFINLLLGPILSPKLIKLRLKVKSWLS